MSDFTELLPGQRSWEEKVKLAENYLAVGQAEQWLWDDREHQQEKPWYLVTACERSGGLITWNGAESAEVVDSAKFTAPHPSGLVFVWTVDLGDYGTGGLLNLERVEDVLGRLTGEARDQFAAMVRQRAEVVRDGAVKTLAEAERRKDHGDAVLALVGAS